MIGGDAVKSLGNGNNTRLPWRPWMTNNNRTTRELFSFLHFQSAENLSNVGGAYVALLWRCEIYDSPHPFPAEWSPPPSRPFSNLVDHLGDDRNCDNKYIEFSWRTWKGEIHEKGEEPRFSIPFPGREKNTKKMTRRKQLRFSRSSHQIILYFSFVYGLQWQKEKNVVIYAVY